MSHAWGDQCLLTAGSRLGPDAGHVHQQPHFWECNLSKECSRIQSFSKDKGPPDGAGEELSMERSTGSLQSWLGGSCSHTHLVGTEPAQRPSPDSTSARALWGRAPACGSLSGRAVSWALRLLSSIPGLYPSEARQHPAARAWRRVQLEMPRIPKQGAWACRFMHM